MSKLNLKSRAVKYENKGSKNSTKIDGLDVASVGLDIFEKLKNNPIATKTIGFSLLFVFLEGLYYLFVNYELSLVVIPVIFTLSLLFTKIKNRSNGRK